MSWSVKRDERCASLQVRRRCAKVRGVTRDRRIGLAALGLGILMIGVSQRIAPLTEPPLYDGVYVPLPYVWFVPPAGLKGGAKGAKGSVGVDGTANRLIAIATAEQDPQAQLLATSGALVLPAGTTSVKFSIEPVLPTELPADGHIDGNVYQISVTNEAGAPLSAPPSALVTVVLVSPHSDPDRTIELDMGQGWQKLATQNQGPGIWLAVVSQFGQFAVVAPGTAASPYPTATPPAGAGASSSSSASPSSPASSTAPASVGDVPSIGVIAGSASPSQAPSAVAASGGGPPIAPIGVGVALAILLAGAILLARSRRKPPTRPSPTYRGAHRR
jgi:hypothetical protein